MTRFSLSLILVLVCSFVLVACGGSEDKKPADKKPKAAAVEEKDQAPSRSELDQIEVGLATFTYEYVLELAKQPDFVNLMKSDQGAAGEIMLEGLKENVENLAPGYELVYEKPADDQKHVLLVIENPLNQEVVAGKGQCGEDENQILLYFGAAEAKDGSTDLIVYAADHESGQMKLSMTQLDRTFKMSCANGFGGLDRADPGFQELRQEGGE